jgi:hypothetical protein
MISLRAFSILSSSVVALAACLAPAPASAADPYDVALARAREASARGDWSGAARAIAVVVDAYPQDYAIAVALGDAQIGGARFADAERSYRLALHRAPDARDARLGLAWSLLGTGDCGAAEDTLGVWGDAPPAADRAEKAIAACNAKPPGPWTIAASWNEYLFPDHPYKASGTGFIAEASRNIDDRFRVDGAYRFVRFATTTSPYVTPFSQNEGYLRAGYDTANVGLLAEGAIIADGSGLYGTTPHVGASARWSRFGDALLQGAASFYKDLTALRLAARWRVPLAGPLSVIPGAAAQLVAGQAFADASLTLAAEWPVLSLWLGGKYGDEVRPAYLDSHVVYDIPERVAWGAWAGARVRVTRGLALQASYSLDRLRRTDKVLPQESDLHALAVGPVVTF